MTKLGSWHVKFELTLNGEDVSFEELSEETQKHIVEQIKEGYYSGEIVEEADDDTVSLHENECPLDESTRFPVNTIEVETKFGKISIEYPIEDNDDDKIRILDSNGSYMDYIERESFENRAEEHGTTFEEEVKAFADELTEITEIADLCNAICCDSWVMAYLEEHWTEIAEYMYYETKEDVLESDFVNRVGEYLILVSEC